MAENQEGAPQVTVEQVLEKNQELVTIANNYKDVLTEMKAMNSDKDVKIAELQATVKRLQAIITNAQPQSAPADESVEEAEEEVVEESASEDE
jgi:hypothetical protein